jgi:hypothetical protein
MKGMTGCWLSLTRSDQARKLLIGLTEPNFYTTPRLEWNAMPSIRGQTKESRIGAADGSGKEKGQAKEGRVRAAEGLGKERSETEASKAEPPEQGAAGLKETLIIVIRVLCSHHAFVHSSCLLCGHTP